jgi:anti-sigma regulatory factor (Ser/Thr protein kinase)
MTDSAMRELSPTAAAEVPCVHGLRHEALFYRGEESFLQGVLPFIADGLRAGEAVIAAVGERPAELLRHTMGGDALRVRFLDVHEIGRNPARLIPAWRKLLDESLEQGRPLRGIGEPSRAGRSSAELEECRRLDALVDVAFADGPPWRLLCPYDLDRLDAETIRQARATHPTLIEGGVARRNDAYDLRQRVPAPFEGELPEPPSDRQELAVVAGGLCAIRHLVAEHGAHAGLSTASREDLVLAVNELVTNSVQHGGGAGMLRIWREPGALVCETSDRGFIRDPFAGRVQPPVEQYGGRGLWLVNHLCDLVQIRSSAGGSAVRVHMRTDREPWPA